MKNLSLETCTRLKDAGFTQPERAPGQLWYCREDLCVLYRVAPDGILGASLEGSAHYGTTNVEDWVYCPTAMELAEKIEYCTIHLLQPHNQQIEFGRKRHCWQSVNLSETLAEIWLSENSKPV